MRKEFIIIKNTRYRISSIERYEPFGKTKEHNNFGIFLYLLVAGQIEKVPHLFEDVAERDFYLLNLDTLFGL